MKSNTFTSQPASSSSIKKSPRRSRISAILLIIAVVISLPPIATPHVILRVSIAIVTIVGLWRAQRWAFPLLWVTGGLWLAIFIVISLFLFVGSPLELWLPWLYWFIPTALVVIACVLMTTAAGRAERETWLIGTNKSMPPKSDNIGEQS